MATITAAVHGSFRVDVTEVAVSGGDGRDGMRQVPADPELFKTPADQFAARLAARKLCAGRDAAIAPTRRSDLGEGAGADDLGDSGAGPTCVVNAEAEVIEVVLKIGQRVSTPC